MDPASSGWGGVTSLFSPGGGHYYRRDANGVVTGWLDASPYNGSGTDLTAYVPAGSESTGWDSLPRRCRTTRGRTAPAGGDVLTTQPQ